MEYQITEENHISEQSSEQTSLYVSTALDSFIADDDPGTIAARDITYRGARYRRLDADYYAWLKSRFDRAARAAAAGQLDAQTYQAARDKFKIIYEWATAHFGAEEISRAARQLIGTNYDPPRLPSAVTATEKRQVKDYIHPELANLRCANCHIMTWWSTSFIAGVYCSCGSVSKAFEIPMEDRARIGQERELVGQPALNTSKSVKTNSEAIAGKEPSTGAPDKEDQFTLF